MDHGDSFLFCKSITIFRPDMHVSVFSYIMTFHYVYLKHETGFKFNIALSDWNFCGDDGFECSQGQTEQVGDKIDVTIEIKGQDSDLPEDSNATDTEYDMGGNATMYLSTKVNVDGEWEEMEEGYPKLELQGELIDGDK